jgi:hypothetical protein
MQAGQGHTRLNFRLCPIRYCGISPGENCLNAERDSGDLLIRSDADRSISSIIVDGDWSSMNANYTGKDNPCTRCGGGTPGPAADFLERSRQAVETAMTAAYVGR